MRISVASPTGGTGRTTLVLNLGLALCQRGLRTLMIDLDPQGCLGLLLARKDDEWLGLADFLMGRVTLERAIKRSNVPFLSLLPRGRLDPADVPEYERALRNPNVLGAGLRNLDQSFDAVLLDLPPGTGMVTRGALALSDELLVTVRAEAVSVRAIPRIMRLFEAVRNGDNPRLRFAGILPTMVSPTSSLADSVLRDMRRKGHPILDQSIPWSALYTRAAEIGQPLARLAGEHSRELGPVRALADSITRRLGKPEDSFDVPRMEEAPRYQRFRERRFREKLLIEEHEAAPGTGPVLDLDALAGSESFGMREWHCFLDACLRATSAETAFVMDSEGLALAARGALGTDQISGLGTRLTIAFEQARQMEIAGGAVQSVLAEFDHLWLSGIAIEVERGDSFTVGLLGLEPISPRLRKEIRVALRTLLEKLIPAAPAEPQEVTLF